MPATAKVHFDEDIKRAKAILSHAVAIRQGPEETDEDKKLSKKLLIDDLLRSAWMFAVGAMDAYFCDAYCFVLASTLRAQSLDSAVELPGFIRRIEIPIGAILKPYSKRPNWRWRMAARAKMEKDNVLDLETVRNLFNPFMEEKNGKKLFLEVLPAWISRPKASARLFGIAPAAYKALVPGTAVDNTNKTAWATMRGRFAKIIQRRHDCIHNCDRPKSRPQKIHSTGTVNAVIEDIVFLVNNFDQHLDAEFGMFLDRIKCTPATKNALGY